MKIMTFNILCAGRGEHHWCRRQSLVKRNILLHSPDVFGVQEAHAGWMRYLANQLEDYAFVGVGKDDGGKKGEYSPVFYKKEKYRLIDSGSFWLSETPHEPSSGWDAAENRICSYAVLEDVLTSQKTAVMNTHLDHIGQTAQLNGIKLVLEKARSFGFPVVLMGDFNVTSDSQVYALVEKSGFSDARSIAQESNNLDTLHIYGRKLLIIDFIFVKNIKVRKLITANDMIDGKYPSDHYPVVAETE